MSEDALELQLLIRAAQRGDETAFEALLTRYETTVYRYVYGMLGNRADAEDVTQEVFVRLWRTLPRYRFQAKFSTYLLRMAHNAATDHLRRERHRSALTQPLSGKDDTGEEYTLPIADADPASDPVQSYLSAERQEILHTALLSLPQEARELLLLRTLQGHSYAELATLLSLSEGTVKSKLHRAKNLLLDLLKKGNFFD